MATASKRPKFLESFEMCSSSAKVFDGEYTKLKSKNLFLFQIPTGVSGNVLSSLLQLKLVVVCI